MELRLWSFKLEILQSWLGTPKPDIEMQIFLTWDYYFKLLFLCEKNQNLLDIQENCIRKLGKILREPKLLSGVYY